MHSLILLLTTHSITCFSMNLITYLFSHWLWFTKLLCDTFSIYSLSMNKYPYAGEKTSTMIFCDSLIALLIIIFNDLCNCFWVSILKLHIWKFHYYFLGFCLIWPSKYVNNLPCTYPFPVQNSLIMSHMECSCWICFKFPFIYFFN